MEIHWGKTVPAKQKLGRLDELVNQPMATYTTLLCTIR